MIDGFDPLDEYAPEPPARDDRGRFAKGVSGNPRGRRIQLKRDPKLPANRRRVVNSVADEEVEVKVNGKPRRMTMFEANVRALAHAGIKDRVAAQRFIDLATETSERDLERRLIAHDARAYYDRLEAENERLREKVSQHSGPVLVIPPNGPLEEWSTNGLLDDDRRIDTALARRRQKPIAGYES
ncbi:DUF5681 domain-containing protein [Pelagerythrobacter sp.]|uniref:DUF5681 domain-containing protein n=1 Tax=Pelagerythrobacter sp. TaxID=2800702 RepID=UPI0035B02B88